MVHPRELPDVEIHRRRVRDGSPIDDRRLRREVDHGRFVRVAPGSFAPTASFQTLTPIDRHFVRVTETVDRVRSPLLLSHFAAASVWGIDLWGAWPELVDTSVRRTGGGRSSGRFRRHTYTERSLETVSWRGHEVTSPAQTVADLTASLPFTRGVVAVDQALWGRRVGGALTTIDAVRELVDTQSARRGSARMRAAVAFGTHLSDSVGESRGRVLIDRLGFPTPVLQHEFGLPGGIARADFFFPSYDHIAEFDGVGKYLDPALRRGRSADEVLLAEKDRGDELRRLVRALSRFRTPALDRPPVLYDILSGDGLPSRFPRPPVGLRWSRGPGRCGRHTSSAALETAGAHDDFWRRHGCANECGARDAACGGPRTSVGAMS